MYNEIKRASHEGAQETGIHTTYYKIQATKHKVDTADSQFHTALLCSAVVDPATILASNKLIFF